MGIPNSFLKVKNQTRDELKMMRLKFVTRVKDECADSFIKIYPRRTYHWSLLEVATTSLFIAPRNVEWNRLDGKINKWH